MFFTCCCWSTTTKKEQEYENVTQCITTLLCTRTLQSVQQRYYVQERYKSLTLSSFDMRVPPSTAHDSSAYPNLTLPSFAMWASSPPPSKPRLLVACTDGCLPVINDTSTMTTQVKGCQLSMIRARKWPVWTITHVVYLYVGSIFRSGIYLCIYHSWASSNDKEWAVSEMQPDLLLCKVVSLVIGIGQGLLARWRGLIFSMSLVFVRVYWLDDKGAPSECHRVW